MATSQKNLSEYSKAMVGDASRLSFGVVVSQWNRDITYSLLEGVKTTLLAEGVVPENIIIWEVPGSFELPFACKKMAKDKKPNAIIAIGCVIKGETMHFDYVCQAVSYGISKLNLMQDIPVVFCVLTDNTLEQSLARSGGKHGNKGVEAAITAIDMALLGS